MNRNLMNQGFSRASLRRHGSAHTVLLQMAADEARAQRLRDLKHGRPGTKWRHIAEYADVSERAVGAWAKTGAMSEDNAKKVAEFFGVDQGWFWWGPRDDTPDLVGALNGSKRADTPVDVRLDAVEGELAGILAEIKTQLAEQTQVLNEIKGLLGIERQTVTDAEEATRDLLDAAREAGRALRNGDPATEVPRERRAKSR